MLGFHRYIANYLNFLHERTNKMSAALDRLTTDVDALHGAVTALIASNADQAAQLRALAANAASADDSAALNALADKVEADTAAATAAIAPAAPAPAPDAPAA